MVMEPRNEPHLSMANRYLSTVYARTLLDEVRVKGLSISVLKISRWGVPDEDSDEDTDLDSDDPLECSVYM